MAFEGKWIHGSAIDKVTREVCFLSVSQVELADTCLRKYWYRYPGGIKEESTEKQARGVKNHAEVARYETTGDKNVNPMVAKGMFMVPPPGDDLLVEWDILTRPGFVYPEKLTEVHSLQLLRDAPLRFNNIPMVGQLDLSHGRCINYGMDDVENTRDPEGTIEVCDWKFVSSDRYLLSQSELKSNTQLAGYAEWVWQVRPQTPQVRISLGYFLEKGRSRKISALVRREDIAPQLEHASGVARSIAHAAKATKPDDVEANTAACSKYGGCPHAGYCTAPMRRSLSSLIGQTAAESISVPKPVPTPQGIIPVTSLLHRPSSGVQASVSVAPAIVGPDPAAVAAEQARIAAEEKAAALRNLVPAGFIEACAAVRAFNRGFPKLTGGAAIAYAASGGQSIAPGVEFAGSGMIDYVVLSEPMQMAQLANDLAGEAPSEPVNALPPDAPSSDPTLAADMPLPGASTMTAVPTTVHVMTSTEAVAAPQAFTATVPTAQAASAPDPMKSEAAVAPKKRGRGPAKPKAAQPAGQKTVNEDAFETADSNALHIYVNCTTTFETIDLTDWAQNLADTLAVAAGADDIRSGSDASNLGFGKWKGVLMALARSAEHAPLDGGNYSISTSYGEIVEVVAQALYLRAKQTGGSYTRGGR